MKTTSYKFGDFRIYACLKSVGEGWEISVKFDKKLIFVGNFIHRDECFRYWKMLTTEIKSFTKTYWIANKSAKTWYAKFFSNHLYKHYYMFLDKLFVKYNKTFKHAFKRDVKKYNKQRRHWDHNERYFLTRAA